ncbi:MAG: helix-turn-helix transcriptional regulator [Nodosilinea sp.]
MPRVLSTQDWDELWDADLTKHETTEHPDSFEVVRSWSSSFDQGRCRDLHLRDLWLTIEESQVQEDIIFQAAPASWGPASSFFVAGTVKSHHHGLMIETLETPGGHYLECIQSERETDHKFAAEGIIRVRFGLAPNVLCQFGEASHLPHELQALACGEPPASFYRQGQTTVDMQVILHQILSCPYRGVVKQMYLEGKVLELAALQFAQFTEQDSSALSTTLKPGDLERLHQAKRILEQQFEQPPSLITLARQVGLNDFKLKQGFRQVFGTTVFGYLRDYRLDQARSLLAEGRLSVQQVAHAVGYAQSSYFARAFRRKFGINPKVYQVKRIRN